MREEQDADEGLDGATRELSDRLGRLVNTLPGTKGREEASPAGQKQPIEETEGRSDETSPDPP